MRAGIHPDHKLTNVKCICGNAFQILSRHEDLSIDICSACHPFYTGTQKFVDSAGRVDKFNKRFAWSDDQLQAAAKKKSKAKKGKAASKDDLKTKLEKRKMFNKQAIEPDKDEKKPRR
jgi:large subunit ribosomal protein L31